MEGREKGEGREHSFEALSRSLNLLRDNNNDNIKRRNETRKEVTAEGAGKKEKK